MVSAQDGSLDRAGPAPYRGGRGFSAITVVAGGAFLVAFSEERYRSDVSGMAEVG